MIGVDLDKLQYNEEERHGKENAQTQVNIKSLFNEEAEKRHVKMYSVIARLPAKTAGKLFL